MSLAIHFILVLLVAVLGAKGTEAADCSPRGPVQFVCGLSGPEDLVQIPGTSWIVVSATQGGPIQVVNTERPTPVAAYPSATARQRVDSAMYASCPGPLDPPASSRSITHGLNVRPGRDGLHTLYVIHHGFRESVEVFEIDARDPTATPTLTWTGCILAPTGVTFNGVAPLPDGGLVATRTFRTGLGDIPAGLDGKDTGEVYEWHRGDGWRLVPGSAGQSPNGIEVSPDGQWLYIALWSGKKVMRLSRGRPNIEKTFVDVSFYPDNLRWQADGSLLTSGPQVPNRDDIMPCMNKSCQAVSARVARIDPRGWKVEEIVNYPSDDVFFGATAAIQVGTEIWIGCSNRDRIARYPMR